MAQGERLGRPVRAGWALRLLASSLSLASATLAADAGAIVLQVKNQTGHALAVYAKPDGCWGEDRRDPDYASLLTGADRVVEAGREGLFAAGSAGCDKNFHDIPLGIKFKNQSGVFVEPQEVGASQIPGGAFGGATPLLSKESRTPLPFLFQWRSNRDRPVGIRYAPQRWLPANPVQRGPTTAPGAGGVYCILDARTKKWSPGSGSQSTDAVEFTVTSDARRCAQDRDVVSAPLNRRPAPRASSPATRAPATPLASSDAGNDKRTVVDLFGIGEALCKVLRFPPARSPNWGGEGCAAIVDASRWDASGLTADVRGRKIEGYARPSFPDKVLLKDQQHNPTNHPATYSVTVEGTKSTSSQTNHCFTFAWGQKLEVRAGGKAGVPFVAEGSVDVTVGTDFNEQWNDCTLAESGSEEKISRTFQVTIPPRTLAEVRVIQHTADLAFNYTADLSFGEPNSAQPLITPLPRAIGMSPARTHPCAGYLAGGAAASDPYSLTGVGLLLQGQQISASNVGLPPSLKTALEALPSFAPIAGDKCPGWPNGYPAAMNFKGRAGVRLHSAGESTGWGPYPGGLLVDLYCTPACGSETPGGPASKRGGTGELVDGEEGPPGDELGGGKGDDLVIAGHDRQAETLAGKDGSDMLEGGKHRQRLLGGGGHDYLEGATGPDALHGGGGSDTVRGDRGDDTLRDDAGDNALIGGHGADTLVGGGEATGAMQGKGGADRLVLDGDEAAVSMHGGAGDDVYRLRDGADPRWATEFARAGEDTIEAGGRFTVPFGIERAIAIDGEGARIDGSVGDQILVGGPGRDHLSGGPGTDRLIGRGGDDELRLGEWGFDRARGGGGADRFVPLGTPVRHPSPARVSADVRPSAHLITDLRPARGDRIVLSPASFGRAVTRLARRPVVREGASPGPRGHRPQLLFARRDSLLRFDADGKRRLPAQAVAILAGFDHLPKRAIEIEP